MQPSQVEAITDIIDEQKIKTAFATNNFSQADLDSVVSRLHAKTMGQFNAKSQSSNSCLLPINNTKDAAFDFRGFSTLFNGYKTFHIYTYIFKGIV